MGGSKAALGEGNTPGGNLNSQEQIKPEMKMLTNQ